MPLPPLPGHTVEIVDEQRDPADAPDAFMRLRRLRLRARWADGAGSDPFPYFLVDRSRLDAVVMAAHFRDAAGIRHVWLRSALRPPVALRPKERSPHPERAGLGELWELPAGLVEPDECSPEGVRRCAAREIAEELGIDVDTARLSPLGPSTFPAPGFVAERHHFFHVDVGGLPRRTPGEDGSALERGAVLAAIPLDEALALVRTGVIEDEKTELGLRRLAEV